MKTIAGLLIPLVLMVIAIPCFAEPGSGMEQGERPFVDAENGIDGTTIIIGVLVLSAVLFGIAGAVMGNSKGAAGNGFVLGALLGPVGLVITAFLEGDRKRCRFCAELIQHKAMVCPHCRHDVGTYRSELPRATSYPDLPPTKMGD